MRCREKKKHFLGPNIDINVSSRGFVALVPFRGLSQGPPAKPKRAIEVDAKPCMVLVRPVSFFHRTPDHDDCQQPTPPCLLQTLDSACSAADQRDPEPAPGTWHLVFAFHPSIPLLCGGLTRFFFFACFSTLVLSIFFRLTIALSRIQGPVLCPPASKHSFTILLTSFSLFPSIRPPTHPSATVSLGLRPKQPSALDRRPFIRQLPAVSSRRIHSVITLGLQHAPGPSGVHFSLEPIVHFVATSRNVC